MDISIKWKLDYKMEIKNDGDDFKLTKLDEPRWIELDLDDILFHSRNYAISLFSSRTPVIIKEDDRYIVNRPELLEQYKKAGKDVRMPSDLKPSTESIELLGFLS